MLQLPCFRKMNRIFHDKQICLGQRNIWHTRTWFANGVKSTLFFPRTLATHVSTPRGHCQVTRVTDGRSQSWRCPRLLKCSCTCVPQGEVTPIATSRETSPLMTSAALQVSVIQRVSDVISVDSPFFACLCFWASTYLSSQKSFTCHRYSLFRNNRAVHAELYAPFRTIHAGASRSPRQKVGVARNQDATLNKDDYQKLNELAISMSWIQ